MSTRAWTFNAPGRVALLAFLLCSPFASGQKQEFAVASVKASKPGGQSYSNFPLGAGDAYIPNGGFFSAANTSLAAYIFFAWQVPGSQAQLFVKQLPQWVMTDKFDIQARAAGNPTKNDMRMMMRALLTERFRFKIHTEVRDVPVLAVVLARPGKLGPGLRAHASDAHCPTSVAAGAPADSVNAADAGFPVICSSVVGMPAENAGRIRSGARNVTMEFLANYLSGEGTFARPLIDATGLNGTYDFAIEWAPQGRPPPGATFTPDPSGPSFEEAIGDQLGLKLKSRNSSMEVIVVDHIEQLSGN
jgi:uncharacterized protein (TIGR03435 family)